MKGEEKEKGGEREIGRVRDRERNLFAEGQWNVRICGYTLIIQKLCN